MRDLWKSSWISSFFLPSRSFGDDCEILFEQMKSGEQTDTKFQPLVGHFMLSDEDFEKFRSKDQDFLQTIQGSAKDFLKLPFTAPFNPPVLNGTEVLYYECTGTRTTFW